MTLREFLIDVKAHHALRSDIVVSEDYDALAIIPAYQALIRILVLTLFHRHSSMDLLWADARALAPDGMINPMEPVTEQPGSKLAGWSLWLLVASFNSMLISHEVDVFLEVFGFDGELTRAS